ncbi:RNA helicase [uncultured Alphaproteobacteria bacterium]|uniref:RNA helicase n=1 Tax=uncultured Alphaproteobacteria bacterium TaxID=91750 RepID=A0A212JMF2_9PROT|nr:RNA helicase [uncultured Alphaproteobacteria bacterium]
MTQFSELGLSEPLLRAVGATGYTQTTPIQANAIPALLSGHDVVGIAQTGTGKTAAFVLPLLHSLAAMPHRAASRSPHALILAPTRELAAQIDANLREYGRFLPLTSTVVVGGVSARPQIAALRRGCDIVVATPGRLLDLMGSGDVSLGEVVWAVLDEADQMMDMGFLPAIRRIMARLPKRRRTALFSATMPVTIRRLAEAFLDRPQEIRVTPAARPAERVAQTVMLVSTAEKQTALQTILDAPEVTSAIVFTRTKRGADRVARQLALKGLAAGAIHGNRSQTQRERTLREFKSGEITVLVATDIAARGLDIEGVSHVINFEIPNTPESYIHRIGRTARAGAAGIAISLCDAAERPLLRDIERLIGRSLVDGADEPTARASMRPGKGISPASKGSHAKSCHRRSQQAALHAA